MIDIHSHLLPFIDDGSDSLEKSVYLIKKAVDEGVSKIVLTPHYNLGEYKLSKDKTKNLFLTFKNQVEALGIKVELCLGQEVYCNENIYNLLKSGEVLTLNDTKCILVEFNYVQETDIVDYVYNLLSFGYVPIIAHVERYGYLTVDDIARLKELGAYIQVNANSVIGEDGKDVQKLVLNLIKNNLVDFVATDIHIRRNSSLKLAYNFISKKFKEEVAKNLFIENAKKII